MFSAALTQVVTSNDKHESAVVFHSLILTDPANDRVVNTGGIQRRGNVSQLNAGRVRKKFEGAVGRDPHGQTQREW